MSVVGIIPARGGSKGLENKNILKLNGKPLIGYVIEQALASNLLDKVVISTDSEIIAKVVRALYTVDVIMRPVELAQDDSPIEGALLHAVNTLKENEGISTDIVVWMQANVPFRPVGLIDEVVDNLLKFVDADSCVTCYEATQRPELMKVANEKNRLQSIKKDVYAIRRQEFPTHYLLDGSVIAMRTKNLIDTYGIRQPHVYLCEEVIPVVQKRAMYSIEVDVEEDLFLAKFYMDRYEIERRELRSEFKTIKNNS